MLPGLALSSWAQVILLHSRDYRLVPPFPALPQRLFLMPLYLSLLFHVLYPSSVSSPRWLQFTIHLCRKTRLTMNCVQKSNWAGCCDAHPQSQIREGSKREHPWALEFKTNLDKVEKLGDRRWGHSSLLSFYLQSQNQDAMSVLMGWREEPDRRSRANGKNTSTEVNPWAGTLSPWMKPGIWPSSPWFP